MSERASEMFALLGTIDPHGAAAGALLTSDEVDVSGFDSIIFLAQAGLVCCSNNVLTLTVYEGTTGACTNSVGTVTRTTTTTDDDFQLMYDFDTSHIASVAYDTMKMTLGFTTGLVGELSGVILGFKPRFHPATDDDLASLYTITQSS